MVRVVDLYFVVNVVDSNYVGRVLSSLFILSAGVFSFTDRPNKIVKNRLSHWWADFQ